MVVNSVVPQGRGNVGFSCQTREADSHIAESNHDLMGCAAAHLATWL